MSSIIKLLIVVDGIFSLTTTYPIDPEQQPFGPVTDAGPDAWFTLSHLIYTLRNCPSPTIVVDTASRGFNSPSGLITNTTPDPYATIKGPNPGNPTPFHFDDPGFNLLEYDEIWLFGYEGYNGGAARGPMSGTSEPGRLSDSELSKITAFMSAGGGVFAVGDHDGLGAGLCGFIPRVRYMRRWFEYGDSSSGLPPNWLPNWPGFGANRVDTLQQGKTDAGVDNEGNLIFFFDDQSDDIPQYLTVLAPTHPAIQGATGVLHVYPDHMHEGEVMVPTAAQLAQPSASNGLGFAGPNFVEFPTINGRPVLPIVLATSSVGTQGPAGIEVGHMTMAPPGMTAEDLPCENQNFSSDYTPCSVKGANNTLAAYDGHKVNVGRIMTDSSWHHFLDLNLLGDPCSSIPTKRMGFNASASGRAYLKEIEAFYVNLAIWLASPKYQSPVPVKSGGSTEILGMVIDPNETPIPGATISFGPLDPTDPVQRTSDAKGMYLFDAFAIDAAFAPNSSVPGYRFPQDPFTITAAKDGYITSSQTTTVVEGQAVIRGFVLQPILPFKMTGKVTSNTAAPISKATVTLFFGLPSQQMVAAAPAVQTYSDGTYTISNVNPGQWTGEYTVTASAPGFLTGTNVILNVFNGQPMKSNFTLMSPHSFDIIVNVTGDFGPQTDPTVEPVTRATVTAYASNQSYPAHNNGGGSYAISNLNPGTYIGDYSVLVEATGFVQQKVDVPQPSGASTTVSVELQPTPPKLPPRPPKPGTAM